MPDKEIDFDSKGYFNRRFGSLKTEYSSFRSHHKDLSDMVRPRRGRFTLEDRNKGDISKHRANSIINSRAGWALRTATAGLLAGTMSPARPFFAFETEDPDLMKFGPVKDWVAGHERLLRKILNQGNFYNMAPLMISELLLFGTGCMTHVEDMADIARFFTHTAGSYMISQNDRYRVDTIAREFQMQTGQMVKMFGIDAVTASVRGAWNKGDYDTWHTVRQLVEPNPNEDLRRANSKFKPFRSVYFEPSESELGLLSTKGFDRFPAYCPRWETTGEDIYATDCPGMTALGDIKSLQVAEKRKAQGVDKMVNPPLQGPPSLATIPVSSLAGGLTIYQSSGEQGSLKPIYQVEPRVNELRADIGAIENRIDKAFFVDMFLAISQAEGVQPRNQLDLMQRNEERLLQLGPVLERVHNEWLDDMIDRLSEQAMQRGLVPEAPEALQGKKLKLRFISSLAMAQKAVAVQSIERTAGFVGQLAAIKPEAPDKFDADEAINTYGAAIGAPSEIILGDDEVQAIRQQRAEAEAKAQQAAMDQQIAETTAIGAGAAKDLASADTSGKNALTDLQGGADA